MTAFTRAALVLSVILGVSLGAGGCVYRPNIQQGNLLKVEDVDQVTAGMTRSQVRYLLGTPMLADPFDPQRWDYIYSFQRGREKKVDKAHFIVRFEGDKVSGVEKMHVYDRSKAAQDQKKAGGDGDPPREPPSLPSIKQPQPDAPRPGGND